MTELKKSRIIAELFEEYSNDILRYAFSILRNTEDAQDALQDVFLKYQKHEDSYRGDCSYKTWLFTITRNTCYDKLKLKKKLTGIEELIYTAAEEVNLDALISLNIAMDRLTPEDNEIIYLKDFEKYSYKEIVLIMGISLANVRSKLYRAKQKLKKMLEEQ